MNTNDHQSLHESAAPDALDFLREQASKGATTNFTQPPPQPSAIELIAGDALSVLSRLSAEQARPAGVEPVARPVGGHAMDVLAGVTPLPLPAGAPDRDIEAWARTAPAPREEE